MSDLKPCPFCGSDDIELLTRGNHEWYECWPCRGNGPYKNTTNQAVEAWNQRAEALKPKVCRWRPIETAPKGGTEILGWRKDCGVMLIRYLSLEDFLTTGQLEKFDEETATSLDWFAADFDSGCRLEGNEVPAHWCRLPEFSGKVEAV